MNDINKTIAVLQDKKICKRCNNAVAEILNLCASCDYDRIEALSEAIKSFNNPLSTKEEARAKLMLIVEEFAG